MVVVADTTPLNYLVLIDTVHVLPALYGRVLIPQQVHRELQHSRTPPRVREWATELPGWCEVRVAGPSNDAGLNDLDAGERDAIQLALDMGIDTLLMDESEGRREAVRLHLNVTGTLAVLEKSAQRGVIDLRVAFDRLERTNFRISAKIRGEFLSRIPDVL